MKKENYGRKIYKHIVSGVIDYSPISLLGRQGFPVRASEWRSSTDFQHDEAGGILSVTRWSIFLMDREVMPESSTIRFKR